MASKIKETSTNAYNLKVLAASCEVNDMLKMISPRWKMQILYCISQGVRQFSRLKEVFPSLSDQVLGKRLKELVDEGLAEKTILNETVPPQVIYTHTEKGAALLAIVLDLHLWGKRDWGTGPLEFCKYSR
ncbi:winged helix-turn-helix transcriptional regulator [Chitinophaga ginsengisoli]|uniref:HxlR family transcriptional regulator n=1 Tax=Chitinophaga ginsengisoli TaxID=363837 RepID=A0A2P8FIC2_9BACT|nr:helix-turn-helix domain-containing protein [Chitinophaga ginsengisoli]PSL21472.1 HxlR family transcriptional regulator [Chitinophaga ginsengisoli]